MSGFGFFDDAEYVEKKRVAAYRQCGKCKLYKKCSSPKMEPSGSGQIPILFISDTPTEKEDRRGRAFVGNANKYFRRELKRVGIDLDRCRMIYAVNCHSSDKLTVAQIDACRPMLFEEIKRFEPQIIVPMGPDSVRALIGHRWNKNLGRIDRWRGAQIPDRDLHAWVAPIHLPTLILQLADKNDAALMLYRRDLKAIRLLLDKPFQIFTEETELVRVLNTYDETRAYLKEVLNSAPALLTLDFEATGLKPHRAGHKIVSCAFAHSGEPEIATAFKMRNRIRPLLKKILTREKIKKVAHHMKFEESWSRCRLGHGIYPWIWDTMLAQHCIDNRDSFCALKFQAYIRWGIIDYDSHLSHFLESSDDDANGFNKIYEIPIHDLLIYNGVDSLLEHRMIAPQMKQFGILDPEHYARGFRASSRSIHEAAEEDLLRAEEVSIRRKRINRGAVRA